MSAHTVFSDDAQRCATTDRDMTANLKLSIAVTEAITHIRAGHPGQAEYVLTRAGHSAERILGPRPTS